jgi:heme A synthase
VSAAPFTFPGLFHPSLELSRSPHVSSGKERHLGAAPEIVMIISALVTFVIVLLVLYLVGLLPVDARTKQIARIVVIIIGVVYLLRLLGVY